MYHHSKETSSTSRAILKAVVRKAELMCRMEAMKKPRELDKEQEQLQWERQILVVKTEIEMNEAQMNPL